MSEPRKMSDPDSPVLMNANPWTLLALVGGIVALALGLVVLGPWAIELGVMLITAAVLLAGIGWTLRRRP